jgi:glycosyltransferase involved in cell wall biosynthesis
LHIAIFIYALTGGGATRRTLTLARELARRGHRIDLVLVSGDGPLSGEVDAAINVIVLDSALLRSLDRLSGVRSRKRRIKASVTALVSYLNHTSPDVMMSAANHVHLVALVAKRLARTRVPLVLRVSNHLTGSHTGPTKRRRPFGLLFARRAYSWADAIIAVSSGIAKDLIERAAIPEHRITTVPNPNQMPTDTDGESFDHPWFAPGEPPVVLAAGRLAPAKDFETLVRAFATVLSGRPARLVLLGEGKQRKRIEELVRTLGLDEVVRMPGFVSDPFPWMRGAAVFVLSSAWEGSPGVLIEAMACGCPVVSTDCPSGPAEILQSGEYGALVPVGDDDALARAILGTLDAPRNPARLRARAAEFDVDTAVDGYVEVLSGVS